MGELLNVRVLSTGEIRTLEDAEPSSSASRFKELSDKIWEKSPKENKLALFAINIARPVEARNMLNLTLREIDNELEISGITSEVKVHGARQEEDIIINPNLLNLPYHAEVGTYNWDYDGSWRFEDIDGKIEAVEFTDGHHDYMRELYFGLNFRNDDGIYSLLYSMQRKQNRQDRNTTLSMTLYDSHHAETGYEGDHLKHVQLSFEQENELLRNFAFLGGIALS